MDMRLLDMFDFVPDRCSMYWGVLSDTRGAKELGWEERQRPLRTHPSGLVPRGVKGAVRYRRPARQ